MKFIAATLLFVGAAAQQNANCDCLDDRCTSQMAVCKNDDTCILAIDCCCACPDADPDCALACVAPYFGNPATLNVGLCGGNEGCWFLKSAEEAVKEVAAPVVEKKADQNNHCDCLDQRCTSQMAVCRNDDACIAGMDCACACPDADPDCALACIAPYFGNPATLNAGICGGNEGCWFLKSAEEAVEEIAAPVVEEKKADQNANCDCLDDRCTSQMAVCRNDDTCILAIDCCCACPDADPDCALACVAPYFGNPATLNVGLCGGNEGCWFLKNGEQKQLRGAALPFPLK